MRRRRTHWWAGVAALVAGVVVSGCGADEASPAAQAPISPAPATTATPAPASTPPPTTMPPPPPPAAPPPAATDGSCEYAFSPNRLSSESPNGSLQLMSYPGMVRGRVLCGSGPYIDVQHGPGPGITASDGAAVQLGQGDTAQVGPYQVRVLGVEGDTVRFALSNPDG